MASANTFMSHESVRHTQEEFKRSTLEQNRYIRQYSLPKTSHVSRKTIHDLGALERLPAEILDVLIEHLSLDSIRVFMCLNRRAALLSSRHPYFLILKRHYVLTLKACYATKACHFITLGQLYKCATTSICHLCGAFAIHISLLMGVKLCRSCIAMSPRTLPVSHHTAEKEYFLPSAVLETVASVLTPPHRESAWYQRLYRGYERYAPGRNEAAQFIKLYDPESLRATAIRFYGTDAELESAVQQRRKTMTNTAEPWVSSNTWTNSARQYQGSRDRILVVIHSPVFEKSTHKWRSAVMCDACWKEFMINYVNREQRVRHRTPTVCYAKAGLALYDMEAMEKHIAEYGPIHGPKNDRLHVTPVVGRLTS